MTLHEPTSIALRVDGRMVPALCAGRADADRIAVLLHGFPDTPWGWAPVMRQLASRGWWAVAPRLHGPGGRTAPERSYQVADLGAEARALCAAVRETSVCARSSSPAQVTLVGHDWGAIAAWFATLKPAGAFDRAVLLSVPPPQCFVSAIVRDRAQRRRSAYMVRFQLPRLPERALETDGGALVAALWRRWSPELDPTAPAVARALVAAQQSLARADHAGAALACYRGLRRAGSVPDRWTALRARIRSLADLTRRPAVPTLLAHGDADGCIGAGAYRGATTWCDSVETIVGAGHFVALAAPDAVCELVIDRAHEPSETTEPTEEPTSE